MGALLRRIRNLYEPALVLGIIAAAAALVYAIWHATRSSADSTPALSIVAAFDDVTGIREKSKVLFKGMPVGTVGEMAYDPASDRVLLRIDIQRPVEIPANIQPYLESSLFGESHLALKTDDSGATGKRLAEVAHSKGNKISELYRLEGVRLSRAESILPGIDQSALRATDATTAAMVEVRELASVSNRALSAIYTDMDDTVLKPVKECTDELRHIAEGPDGQRDHKLAGELREIIDQLDQDTHELNALFQGTPDGKTKGLLQLSQEAGGDWNKVTQRLLSGSGAAFTDLQSMAKSLQRAGTAIEHSEAEVKKLGAASAQLGDASKSVETFMEMLKLKPNAVVWGLSDAQKAMIDQRRKQPPH